MRFVWSVSFFLWSIVINFCADSSDFVLSSPTLVLGNLTRRACAQVALINDEVFEDSMETLNITVSNFSLTNEDLVGFASVSVTQIIIRDDDRFAVVGFLGNFTQVSVSESAGSVTLCVSLQSPEPGMPFSSEIEIVVGTRPGTAGENGYVITSKPAHVLHLVPSMLRTPVLVLY